MADKFQDAISKGARAQIVLDGDLFKEAARAVQAEYILAWRNSPANAVDARERYWMAVQVVDRVHDHLIKQMNDGKLARAEIEQITRARAA